MQHPSLRLVSFTLALVAITSPALAADPSADPWQEKPPATDEQEAEVLKAPAVVPEAAPEPAPAAPPAPPPRRPVAAPRPRRVAQAGDEPAASASVADEDRMALAIELGTNGFASGALEGGVFIGARTSGTLILGGLLDYAYSSGTVVSESGDRVTIGSSTFRLGGGLRYTFVRSADRRVELVGAFDAGIVYQTSEDGTQTVNGSSMASATGFTLAAGPALRYWVHEHIAIGYVARLRTTHLSGNADAFSTASPRIDGLTSIAFAGTFQILGVF